MSVSSIVARPVCLAHCAHPPTDGRIDGENSAAGRSHGRKGDEEQQSCSQPSGLGKGSMHGGSWGDEGSGKGPMITRRTSLYISVAWVEIDKSRLIHCALGHGEKHLAQPSRWPL